MSCTSSTTISEAQLQQMAAEIHQEIPGAEVRLLYSQSQVEERRHWLSHVIARAYREGRVLHGQP